MVKRIGLVVLAFILVFSLFTVGAAADETAADDAAADHSFDPETGMNPDKDEYYFVFIPKLVHPFYEPIEAGIKAAIDDYTADGVTITYDWDAPAEADAVVQTQKIEASAAKKPDCLAISVQDPNVIDPIITDVMAAGVPVVTFTDDSASNERLAFVGLKDFYAHGTIIGEELAQQLGGEGEVGMLIGTMSATPHIQRTQGIKDALANYPGITIVSEMADDDDLEKAVQLTEQMMNAYPDIKAFTSSDGSAHAGAARAVKDAGKTDEITIVGFDDIDETIAGIKDGSIYVSMAQDCYNTGYWLVQLMVDAADGKITEPQEVWVDTLLIKQDTLEEFGY